MKLAIADPPYPPMIAAGGRKNRASRWYGDGQRSVTDRPADRHDEAREWDDPARHRQLLEDLAALYDGWAISTCPDGLAAYGSLPVGVRIGAWVKPNAQPGAHRLRSVWEPVIIFVPQGRRSNRGGRGQISDVHTEMAPRGGFVGQKPEGYVHWLLRAMSFDPSEDVVSDIFPGSGAVTRAIATYAP